MFDGEELMQFVDLATWVTVNDYEAQLLQERTGKSLEELAAQVEALIVTLGGEGSRIYRGSERLDVPAARVDAVKDPTGCGDAYRAGLLYGIDQGMDWETTGRVAALMGAIKIEQHGTQNHGFEADGFADRFKQNFGYAPNQ
jgi:adenosine kinase